MIHQIGIDYKLAINYLCSELLRQKKQLDAIVLNSLNDKGAGFGGDKNKITFIDKTGEKTAFDLKSKAAVARDIFDQIIRLR